MGCVLNSSVRGVSASSFRGVLRSTNATWHLRFFSMNLVFNEATDGDCEYRREIQAPRWVTSRIWLARRAWLRMLTVGSAVDIIFSFAPSEFIWNQMIWWRHLRASYEHFTVQLPYPVEALQTIVDQRIRLNELIRFCGICRTFHIIFKNWSVGSLSWSMHRHLEQTQHAILISSDVSVM